MAAGQYQQALGLLAEAQRRHPGDARLVHLTGLALFKLQLVAQAIGAFYHALELSPDDPNIHTSLAGALVADGHPEDALRHAQLAYRQAPTAMNAATLSCALIEAGQLGPALSLTEAWAAGGQPGAEVLVNRSIALEGLGQPEDAVASARAAAALSPTPVIRHHLAALLLSQGHLTPEAWALYEARLQSEAGRRWPDARRRWNGEPLHGNTLLLHAEQGLGDTLQFVRYVPLAAARGASVVLVVQPALKRLLQRTPGAVDVVAVNDALPAFDAYVPLLSLPGVFGTTLETVPPALPYQLPRVQRHRGPLRIGLVWAGSRSFIEDRKRSVAAEALWHVGRDLPAELFSLQLPRGALPPTVTDLMDDVTDMADTADRLATIDLLITVDTAVAHLAGTMGKPVWLLSRFRGCWRWLDRGTVTPWYPSMTIYRQPRPGDWTAVLDAVRADLVRLCRS